MRRQGRRRRLVRGLGTTALTTGWLILLAAGAAWAQAPDERPKGAFAAAAFVVLVPFMSAGLVGAALVVSAVCPRFASRTRLAARNHTMATFWWGLCLLILALILLAIFGNAGEFGKLLAVLGVVGLVGIVMAGLCGVGGALGERILERAESKRMSQPTWIVLAGAATLCVASWVPVLGWLAGLVACLLSLGAVAQALFHGRTLDREADLGARLPTVPAPVAPRPAEAAAPPMPVAPAMPMPAPVAPPAPAWAPPPAAPPPAPSAEAPPPGTIPPPA